MCQPRSGCSTGRLKWTDGHSVRFGERERQKREFSWGDKEIDGQYEKVQELKMRQPLKKKSNSPKQVMACLRQMNLSGSEQ